MGIFDREEKPPPAPREAKYTVEKTAVLLEQFGLMRLQVRDPRLKVLITKIAWEAIPSLEQSSGGKPTGDLIARMMTSVAWLIETIEGYVKIQDHPNPNAFAANGGVAVLMQKGTQAVEKYYRDLTSTRRSATTDLGSYEALTDFLSGNSTAIS